MGIVCRKVPRYTRQATLSQLSQIKPPDGHTFQNWFIIAAAVGNQFDRHQSAKQLAILLESCLGWHVHQAAT